MKKGVTLQHENECMDRQVPIVKIRRIKERLEVLLANGLEQLGDMDEPLDKATEANKPHKRPVVWGDDTRRRHRQSQQGQVES